MKGRISTKKNYLFHFIVLSILIIYLLSADLLFTQFFIVKGESQIVSMNLSGASEDIRYNIDHIYSNQIEWKEMITITGWGFIDNQDTENCSIFLVFSGDNSRYIFKTSPILRRDVTQHFTNKFKNTQNLDNSGFKASIPKKLIDNNNYRLGILIENQTHQKYILTNNYCTNGNCSIIEARIDS
jgi:hypothetical protein